jgi:hypothetical protein
MRSLMDEVRTKTPKLPASGELQKVLVFRKVKFFT